MASFETDYTAMDGQLNIKKRVYLPTNLLKGYNERHFSKCRNTSVNVITSVSVETFSKCKHFSKCRNSSVSVGTSISVYISVSEETLQ